MNRFFESKSPKYYPLERELRRDELRLIEMKDSEKHWILEACFGFLEDSLSGNKDFESDPKNQEHFKILDGLFHGFPVVVSWSTDDKIRGCYGPHGGGASFTKNLKRLCYYAKHEEKNPITIADTNKLECKIYILYGFNDEMTEFTWKVETQGVRMAFETDFKGEDLDTYGNPVMYYADFLPGEASNFANSKYPALHEMIRRTGYLDKVDKQGNKFLMSKELMLRIYSNLITYYSQTISGNKELVDEYNREQN